MNIESQKLLLERIVENHKDDLNLLNLALVATENGGDILSQHAALLHTIFSDNKYEYNIVDLGHKRSDYYGLYNDHEKHLTEIVEKIQTKNLWDSLLKRIKNNKLNALEVGFLVDARINILLIENLFLNPIYNQKAKNYFQDKLWDLRDGDLPPKAPTLHYAVSKNKLNIIKVLCDNGFDINQKDSHGNTPLFYANSTKALNLLELYKPNLTLLNKKGESASEVIFKNSYGSDYAAMQKHSIWSGDILSVKTILNKSFENDKVSDFKEKFKNHKDKIDLNVDSNIILGNLKHLGQPSVHQKISFLIKNGLNYNQTVLNEESNSLLISAIIANIYLKNNTQQNAKDIYKKTIEDINNSITNKFNYEQLGTQIATLMIETEGSTYASEAVAKQYLDKLKQFKFPFETKNVLSGYSKLLKNQLDKSDYKNESLFPAVDTLKPWIQAAYHSGNYKEALIGCIWLLPKFILSTETHEFMGEVHKILHEQMNHEKDIKLVEKLLNLCKELYKDNFAEHQKKTNNIYASSHLKKFNNPSENEFFLNIENVVNSKKLNSAVGLQKQPVEKMKML